MKGDKESLCWTCKNCIGKCSWSKKFQPVEEWEAIPTEIIFKDEIVHSFHVVNCPSYEYEGKCSKCKYADKYLLDIFNDNYQIYCLHKSTNIKEKCVNYKNKKFEEYKRKAKK